MECTYIYLYGCDFGKLYSNFTYSRYLYFVLITKMDCKLQSYLKTSPAVGKMASAKSRMTTIVEVRVKFNEIIFLNNRKYTLSNNVTLSKSKSTLSSILGR